MLGEISVTGAHRKQLARARAQVIRGPGLRSRARGYGKPLV
jgi:hypothetical protein